MNVEKIAAVTLRVVNMRQSVQFYRDVWGMEISSQDAHLTVDLASASSFLNIR